MKKESENQKQHESSESARAPAADRRPPAGARATHRWKTRARLKVLLIALLLLSAVGAIVWFLSVKYWTMPVTPIRTQPTPETLPNANARAAENSVAAPSATPVETPPASPSVAPSASPSAEPAPQQQGSATPSEASPPNAPDASGQTLQVPVQGVRPEDLRDTYTESRSEGRTHNAIDIMAPRGTPVIAATDGRVVKLFNSVPGGITLYQLATDDKTILYYSHLDRYADGLAEGHFARRGEVIGYVGDTGNAGAGNYHLHFSVSVTDDPKRWWDGTNVNPYPLLTGKQ